MVPINKTVSLTKYAIQEGEISRHWISFLQKHLELMYHEDAVTVEVAKNAVSEPDN